jgi:hypothetical protein
MWAPARVEEERRRAERAAQEVQKRAAARVIAPVTPEALNYARQEVHRAVREESDAWEPTCRVCHTPQHHEAHRASAGRKVELARIEYDALREQYEDEQANARHEATIRLTETSVRLAHTNTRVASAVAAAVFVSMLAAIASAAAAVYQARHAVTPIVNVQMPQGSAAGSR